MAVVQTGGVIRPGDPIELQLPSPRHRRLERVGPVKIKSWRKATASPTSPPMSQITVAALQLGFTSDIDRNIAAVSRLVHEAVARGAQVILPPELFDGE